MTFNIIMATDKFDRLLTENDGWMHHNVDVAVKTSDAVYQNQEIILILSQRAQNMHSIRFMGQIQFSKFSILMKSDSIQSLSKHLLIEMNLIG